MSELSINLKWSLGEGELTPGKIPNSHEVIFNQDYKIISDAAPDWGGSPSNTNPEQALAAKMKWPVSSYEDKADAVLGKNSKGQMAVTKITLHPVVTFEGDFSIGDQEMKEMHDRSHRYCFVANSLSDEVGFEVVL